MGFFFSSNPSGDSPTPRGHTSRAFPPTLPPAASSSQRGGEASSGQISSSWGGHCDSTTGPGPKPLVPVGEIMGNMYTSSRLLTAVSLEWFSFSSRGYPCKPDDSGKHLIFVPEGGSQLRIDTSVLFTRAVFHPYKACVCVCVTLIKIKQVGEQ